MEQEKLAAQKQARLEIQARARLNNYDPVWKQAWRSLTLGVEVKDPMAGPVSN